MNAPRIELPAPRIDAHVHLWRLARGDYPWPTPDLAALHRDFEPAELRALLDASSIDLAIAVQAAPTVAETEFLLDHAREHRWIAGVVGWIDLESDDAHAELDRLLARGNLVGVRPMMQDLDDPRWMLRPTLRRAFAAIVERDLVLDALVRPRHLGALAELLERETALRVVVDHAGKPTIAPDRLGFDSWRASLARVADHPRANVKLSGLATEARGAWSERDLAPYVDAILELFGGDRVLWGSDWPVIELAGGYGRWRDATERLLSASSGEVRGGVLGGNAARVYRLAPARPCAAQG